MLIKVNEYNIDNVFKYIGEDYCRCIYLYLDLKKYGTTDENINSWIQYKENNICCIILKYYDGMHLYSKKGDFLEYEIENLINNTKPTMICGETKIIEKLKLNDYDYEKGSVRYLDQINYQEIEKVSKAEKEDFVQIGKLLYEDEDLGCSYKLEDLIKQLYERNTNGYTRNYVIKENGKVISHAGTGAENEKLAMLAYVITAPEYRGKGLAKKVCYAVCKDIVNEGRKICLINYSNESTRLYEQLGFKKYCDWSKLYKNLKKVER